MSMSIGMFISSPFSFSRYAVSRDKPGTYGWLCLGFGVGVLGDLDVCGRFANVDFELAIYRADVYFSILGDVGQQDAQAQWDRQEALDDAAQGARTLGLAEALFAE